MTPIERVSARGRALSTLGLASTASLEEVHSAYRGLARTRHPDLGKTGARDFAEINAAHDYLVKNAKLLGIAERNHPSHPSVKRPSVSATEFDLSERELSECKSVLQTKADKDSGQHTPVSIRRRGRQITYVVRSALQAGKNLIAVPTGSLVDNRQVLPQIVSVEDTDIRNGAYNVPANICLELFPGAKSVRIQFSNAT